MTVQERLCVYECLCIWGSPVFFVLVWMAFMVFQSLLNINLYFILEFPSRRSDWHVNMFRNPHTLALAQLLLFPLESAIRVWLLSLWPLNSDLSVFIIYRCEEKRRYFAVGGRSISGNERQLHWRYKPWDYYY